MASSLQLLFPPTGTIQTLYIRVYIWLCLQGSDIKNPALCLSCISRLLQRMAGCPGFTFSKHSREMPATWILYHEPTLCNSEEHDIKSCWGRSVVIQLALARMLADILFRNDLMRQEGTASSTGLLTPLTWKSHWNHLLLPTLKFKFKEINRNKAQNLGESGWVLEVRTMCSRGWRRRERLLFTYTAASE